MCGLKHLVKIEIHTTTEMVKHSLDSNQSTLVAYLVVHVR
nr:MAG TPA: hypothetical protein [Caudoviricetes sp.]